MYRINKLLEINRKLFHTNDLAILWDIEDRHHLHIIISRYLKKGILYPVYKGLYSIIPIHELNPIDLGRSIIHSYTYLSTESILSQAGIISQTVYDFTYIADHSKKVKVDKWVFRYRQMQDEFLHHPAGIVEKDGSYFATTERAIADMLYYNPRYHFDIVELIDFEKIKLIQEKIGYARIRT